MRRAITSTSDSSRTVTSGGSVAVTDKPESRGLVIWAILFPLHKKLAVSVPIVAQALCGVQNLDWFGALRRSLHPPGAGPVAAELRHRFRRDRSVAAQPAVAVRPAPHLSDRAVGSLLDRDVHPRLLRGHRFL